MEGLSLAATRKLIPRGFENTDKTGEDGEILMITKDQVKITTVSEITLVYISKYYISAV